MEPRIYEILVVDDNPADLYIIQEAFAQCGFRCHLTTGSSSKGAEQLLQRERFDLLLSDFGADAEEEKLYPLGSRRKPISADYRFEWKLQFKSGVRERRECLRAQVG